MNLKFILHSKSNKKGEKPIYLRATLQSKAVDIRTKKRILPKFWKKETGTIKNTNAYPRAMEERLLLAQMKETALSVYNQYKIKHKREPNPKVLKQLVETELFARDTQIEYNLISYYEQYIPTLPTKLNAYGRPVSKGYIRSHKNTLNKIKDFVKAENISIEFEDLDSYFYEAFLEFLYQKDYANNYVGKQIKNIKTVLNEATIKGINTSLKYKVFKEIAEEIDAIYLSKEELELFYNLDLSSDKKLESARDMFVVSAWTGLRHSDYNNINEKADIQDEAIYIKTEKSQKPVAVPLHPHTKAILSKYNNKLPTLQYSRYNDYLKQIGKLLPFLQENFTKEYTRGGKLIKETKPKYQVLSTHTARRSFATNLFLTGKFAAQDIMKVTGHTKESTFYKYIKLTPDHHAKKINDYFNE